MRWGEYDCQKYMFEKIILEVWRALNAPKNYDLVIEEQK